MSKSVVVTRLRRAGYQTGSDQTVKLLKALGNPTRLNLVRWLAACPTGSSCSDLSTKTVLSQPTMSHHFLKLVEARVIAEKQIGATKHYMLNRPLLEANGININKLRKHS